MKPASSAEEIIAAESAARADGFVEVPLDDHAAVIVQYMIDGWRSVADLDMRHEVEDILNECLGWTGNGHCNGGDIGSGTMNLFSYVIDPVLAKEAIVVALRSADRLSGAVIAFRRGEENETVLWPDDFQGEFSIL